MFPQPQGKNPAIVLMDLLSFVKRTASLKTQLQSTATVDQLFQREKLKTFGGNLSLTILLLRLLLL